MADLNRDADFAAMSRLTAAVSELQAAAAMAGLQKIDLQLTGRDDHQQLRWLSSALHGVVIDHRTRTEDALAGATIYPAYARPNRAGT